jgi:hypothetical protein
MIYSESSRSASGSARRLSSPAGATGLTWNGRIGKHALAPGAYRLVATVGGTKSTVAFTIAR